MQERSSINYLIQQVKKLLPGWNGKSGMIIVQDTPENREKCLCPNVRVTLTTVKERFYIVAEAGAYATLRQRDATAVSVLFIMRIILQGYTFATKKKLGQAIL